MEVHKYEALTIQDALKLIKKDLGKDAVILSNKVIEKSVEGSAKTCKMVEVLATASSAKSESSIQTSTMTPRKTFTAEEGAKLPVATFPNMKKESDVQVVKGSPRLNKLIAEYGNPSAEKKSGSNKLDFSDLMVGTRNASKPAPAALQQSAQRTSQTPSANKIDSERQAGMGMFVDEIRHEVQKIKRDIESMPQVNLGNEVQEIKVLLHDLMYRQMQDVKTQRWHDYLENIAIKLRTAGVMETIIIEIMQVVSGMDIPKTPEGVPFAGEKLREFYLNALIRQIFKEIKVTGPWKNTPGEQKIYAFVGPTGVGKTTTIAKIAARMKISEQKKVGLISLDTMRISGSEQLRVYAKILECPFIEVTNYSELTKFVTKHHDYDYLFIDTAGRSVRNPAEMESIKQLGKLELPIHFELVLSAGMKQRDMEENYRAMRCLGIESLVFTKLDESWGYGEILNTAVKSGLPVSWFTCGQKVPDDLELAAKERIIERIFQL